MMHLAETFIPFCPHVDADSPSLPSLIVDPFESCSQTFLSVPPPLDFHDLDSSIPFLGTFQFEDSSDIAAHISQRPTGSAQRCNRKSRVVSHDLARDQRMFDRSSAPSKSWREDLCHCTEELGSESISCSVEGRSDGAAHEHFQRNTDVRVIHDETNKLKIAPVKVGCPSKDSFDFVEKTPPLRCATLQGHRRTFPPPISSLSSNRSLMRSFKWNGRFVLQRVEIPSNSTFRAIREDGRLRLELISPRRIQAIGNEDGEKVVSPSMISEDENGEEGVEISSLRKNSATLFECAALQDFSSKSSRVALRDAELLKNRISPYHFHVGNQRLLFSKALGVTCRRELELAVDLVTLACWEQSTARRKRDLLSNVSDQRVPAVRHSLRRGKQVIAIAAQHRFAAVLTLCSFKLNLLLFHIENSKSSMKSNGALIWLKDTEIENGKEQWRIQSAHGGTMDKFSGNEGAKLEVFPAFDMLESRLNPRTRELVCSEFAKFSSAVPKIEKSIVVIPSRDSSGLIHLN